MRNEIDLLKKGVYASEDEGTLKIVEEVKQQDFRRRNVIVSGVPIPSGELEERKMADQDSVTKLNDYLAVDAPDVEEIHQIGRPGNQHLLKIRYKESRIRDSVLRKNKTLRNCEDFKKIFINPDLTPLQQREQQKLRSELQERRDLGQDVMIFRNRVINRSQRPNFR